MVFLLAFLKIQLKGIPSQKDTPFCRWRAILEAGGVLILRATRANRDLTFRHVSRSGGPQNDEAPTSKRSPSSALLPVSGAGFPYQIDSKRGFP